MKKDKPSRMKALFQVAAMAMAVFTGEDQAAAAKSAGLAYDNMRSGLTMRNLRETFGGRVSFARKTDGSKKFRAHKPERVSKTTSASKASPKHKRYTARREI